MTKLLALSCSVLALVLVAAGCGSSNSSSGGSSSKTTKTKAAPPAKPKSGGKTVSVSMKNIQFNPKALVVTKGTTVKWTNDDSVNHDVTKKAGPGPDFASGQGNLAKGATYQQTLNTPGTIAYVCTVHPGMAGVIHVK